MPHRHRTVRSETFRCFSGEARAPNERGHEPRAHGGVSYIDTCCCGATRLVNASATFREFGPWREREEEQ